MQRQWAIEARADFTDPAKNKTIDEAFRRAARHIDAQLQLLSDGQKPQVVCFSDDFVDDHEDLSVRPDELRQVLEQHKEWAEEEVSDSMLRAAKEME